MDPTDCYFYLNSDKTPLAASQVIDDLLKEFSKEEQILKASIIGARLNISMPTTQQVDLLLGRLRSKLKLDQSLDVSLLNAKEVKAEKHATYCLTSIALWRVALDFPRKDREALLRFLYK